MLNIKVCYWWIRIGTVGILLNGPYKRAILRNLLNAQHTHDPIYNMYSRLTVYDMVKMKKYKNNEKNKT